MAMIERSDEKVDRWIDCKQRAREKWSTIKQMLQRLQDEEIDDGQVCELSEWLSKLEGNTCNCVWWEVTNSIEKRNKVSKQACEKWKALDLFVRIICSEYKLNVNIESAYSVILVCQEDARRWERGRREGNQGKVFSIMHVKGRESIFSSVKGKRNKKQKKRKKNLLHLVTFFHVTRYWQVACRQLKRTLFLVLSTQVWCIEVRKCETMRWGERESWKRWSQTIDHEWVKQVACK